MRLRFSTARPQLRPGAVALTTIVSSCPRANRTLEIAGDVAFALTVVSLSFWNDLHHTFVRSVCHADLSLPDEVC